MNKNRQHFTGLTTREADLRLSEFGPNQLTAKPPHPVLMVLRETLTEPMFLLLIAAGAIYMLLGDIHEAMLLVGFVLIIVVVTALQSHRTARALAALKELSSPHTHVLRDDEWQQIPAENLVPGDVIQIGEGERCPADGQLLSAHELAVDESLLTGESVPIAKFVLSADAPRTRADLCAGTVVTRGQGILQITATGTLTQLGQIGTSLAEMEDTPSPLQQEIRHFIRRFTLFGGAVSFIVLLLIGLIRGQWVEGFLAGIMLAMSLLPQEFSVILTVFMALGARRIATHGVLTRRLSAIETLGETRVLCVDKTGTLTRNRMAVRMLSVGDDLLDVNEIQVSTLPEAFHELVEYGILASELEPLDPMELAIHQIGKVQLSGTEHLHNNWVLAREYEIAPDLLAMSHLWQAPGFKHFPVACKGAPEAVADLCHLPPQASQAMLARADEMAKHGLRVLAVARAQHNHENWPEIQHDFVFELLGLVGLADPLKTEVPQAITACHNAGVRVVMITGDHPATARAIADEAGIPSSQVITGDQLKNMTDEELSLKVSSVNIFARIAPIQKLRLVNAFKRGGDVVAMTGDGVNDTPALKAAHIGIAMGNRGTDVARQAADLVLVADDFAAIVQAMRMGRRIYHNLVKAITYAIAAHLPIIGIAMLPLPFGAPMMLTPALIAFLELVISPTCSIVFEAETAPERLMHEPPRSQGMQLFSKRTLLRSVAQGASVFAATGLTYWIARTIGMEEAEARTLGFLTLVLGNLGLVYVNRDLDSHWMAVNWQFVSVAVGSLGLMLLIIHQSTLAALFGFSPPETKYYALIIVCVITGSLCAALGGKIVDIFIDKLKK
ncbi:cation-translocating P-type ATPase [Prodigiosinella aquatilis]|nr:cation-translocating P-type ATPase [Prodigiosinella sp. LS101]WJV54759.1 cation-translocating P-type ATPase [Prodigiosinella sp. LS101]WJV59123.1 cation-translocating P-type ATPase [Pectobacteriaceae bacterium C111]